MANQQTTVHFIVLYLFNFIEHLLNMNIVKGFKFPHGLYCKICIHVCLCLKYIYLCIYYFNWIYIEILLSCSYFQIFSSVAGMFIHTYKITCSYHCFVYSVSLDSSNYSILKSTYKTKNISLKEEKKIFGK